MLLGRNRDDAFTELVVIFCGFGLLLGSLSADDLLILALVFSSVVGFVFGYSPRGFAALLASLVSSLVHYGSHASIGLYSFVAIGFGFIFRAILWIYLPDRRDSWWLKK